MQIRMLVGHAHSNWATTDVLYFELDKYNKTNYFKLFCFPKKKKVKNLKSQKK